jgi:Calcineurin-like phosphoesterase
MRACVVGAVLTGLMQINAFVPSAGATPGYAAQLTRYPYLTDLAGLSVAVNWATDTSGTTGSSLWGAVDGSGNCTPTTSVKASRSTITVNNVSEYQWKSVLTLPASGAYCYRVKLGATDLLGTDASPQFTTQVPAGSTAPFSFAVFGDWGQTDASGNSPDTANLMTQIGASGARFAFTTGDNGYPSGNQTNAGDIRQTGKDISAIFGPSIWAGPGRSIPLFPAAGNHGFSSGAATRSVDEINFPQDVAVATSGGRYIRETYCCVNGTKSASYPSAWYAFDAGNARFYVLDAGWADGNAGTGTVYSDDYATHWTPSSPEYQWLQSDLASHASTLKFAFMHYPLYSDQKAQNSDTFLQGPNSLEGLLASHGVDLAFSGHAHLYERNVATGPGTFPSYITGGGGEALQPIGEVKCNAYDAYGIGWSPTKNKGSKCGAAPVPDAVTRVVHFLKVTVNGTSVTVTPTDELGRTFDVVTYDFSNQLPDTQIDGAPPALTNSTAASLSFHSSDGGATFNCQLDGGGFVPCTSPQGYSGLAEGAHTFAVQAVTGAGSDPTPATATWTVDTTPPSQPTGLTPTAPLPGLVNLTWSASSDAHGVPQYQIERDGVVIGSSAGASFSDPTVAANTTYSYDVIALDGANNPSQPSDVAPITTPGSTQLVFSDGFESGSLSAWTAKGGLTVQSAITHAGAFAAQGNTSNGNTYAKKVLPSTYSDAYSRIWFNAVSASSQVNLLRYRTATDASLGYLFITSTGLLGVRNDVAATTTTSAKGITIGSGWHSLELHMAVNGTSSTIEVWLDGAIVSDLSTTTANLGTAPVGKFQIGDVQTARTYNVVYDDAAFATQRIGP